ncbi:PAS domain-containing protein [Flavobacterium sp. ASW18X]|uniref:PAS domain-containing protein n=1 Tax=Flavobacterium sp. ASW18X TaxID=2572595 RepID=UPI0010ADECD2|nr:PAS domain-containing protein [Flavobacterium sp. ASW18X]TKD65137.1 PAS domain S-box protein [Flavobacterium sp. ASW18X]
MDSIRKLSNVSINGNSRGVFNSADKSQSYRIFKTFFETSLDAIVAISLDGIVLDCNRNFVHLRRKTSKSQLVGKKFKSIISVEAYRLYKKHLSTLLAGGTYQDIRHKIKDQETGDYRYISVNAFTISSHTDKPEFIVLSLRDITKEILADKKLSEQLFAFEQCADSFWTWDLKQNHTRNKSIHETLGYKESEVEDTVETWFSLMHPQDKIKVDALLKKHFYTKGKSPFEVVQRFKNAQGNYTHIYTRGKVIEWSDEGEPLKMIGTEIDITDSVKVPQLEEELTNKSQIFEQVLENTMAGYWDWNILENTEYLSPSFKKMFGYEDHEMENTPEAWQKIIHPDDLPGVFNVFNAHVESKGEIPYDNEVRYYHKNGSIVWVLCRGKVIEWAEDGSPVRMVGSHIDITHLKNLLKSNEDLERFAYLASHDLQEPLRTIRDFIALFEEEYGKKIGVEGLSYLEFINNSCNRMNALIKGLLEYSRVGRDSAKTTVDLNHVIADVFKDLKTRIQTQSATINFKRLPKVVGNTVELHSLFLNLIGNALKFRKKEENPFIDITSRRTKGMIEIAIKDNGIGIPEEKVDQVFQIFKRLNSKEEFEGTGIGLSQCKKIVESHDGSIWVTSKFGQGSTFYFTLMEA